MSKLNSYNYFTKIDIALSYFIRFLWKKKNCKLNSNKIIIIKAAEQGSSTYLLEYLKNLSKEYDIHFFCLKGNEEIFKYYGCNMTFHSIGSLFDLLKFLLFLMRNNFKYFINLEQYRFYPTILTYFTSAEKYLGFFNPSFKKGHINYYTLTKEKHIQENYQEIFKHFNLYIDNKIMFQENKKFDIVIRPNVLDQLYGRNWPLDNYIELYQKIKDRFPNKTIVIIGIADEEKLYEKNFDCPVICNLKNISELIEFYKTVSLQITSDSGPAHWSALQGVKNITLFGPETPSFISPINSINIYKPNKSAENFSFENYAIIKNKQSINNIKVDDVMIEINNFFTKEKK